MPRPILKRGNTPPAAEPDVFPFADSSLRHVAFHAELSEHSVHSPGAYDRSPIVVDRTYSCALPARGCPGRTFEDKHHDNDDDDEEDDVLRHSLHTLATARYPDHRILHQPPPVLPPPCPELCSSSSESDESSDGFASPTPELWDYSASSAYQSFPDNCSSTPTQERPLSFLPHPNPHAPAPAPEPSTPTRRFDLCSASSGRRPATPKPRANRKPSPSKAVRRDMACRGREEDNDDGCLGGF